VHFHTGNADVSFCHYFEAVVDLRHARIRPEATALGKLNLEGIVFGVLRRKVFHAKRFAMGFNFLDQLQWNVMMMNVDG